MARFETETLSPTDNLKHRMDLSGPWIDQAHRHRKLTKLILDMDSEVGRRRDKRIGTSLPGVRDPSREPVAETEAREGCLGEALSLGWSERRQHGTTYFLEDPCNRTFGG
jgi:hypothetical protein